MLPKIPKPMKKYLITGVLVLIIATAFGQKEYSFGFEVAPHISWAKSNTKYVKQKSSTIGFKYGLRGDSYFAKNYAITSGLMISHTSIGLEYSLKYEKDGIIYFDPLSLETVDETYIFDSVEQLDISYGFQYLEIPLGLKFRSDEIGYLRVQFEGGFIPGVKLKSTVSSEKKEIEKEELNNGTSLFALSYYFEGGITYSLGAQIAIKASVYYASGMIDLTTKEIREKEDNISQNQAGLKLGVVF